MKDLVKFSSGTWTSSEEDGMATYFESIKANVVQSDQPTWIALVQCESNKEQGDANQRLILQAPEMFWELVRISLYINHKAIFDILSKVLNKEITLKDTEELWDYYISQIKPNERVCIESD